MATQSRKSYPGTPGITAHDFVGVSHDSLVMMLESDEAVAPAAFHAALIETVREYGATFNQRVLLKAAFNRALGVKGY